MAPQYEPARPIQLETLEAREVPAIVLAGTFANGATTATGGAVTVTELAGGTYSVFNNAQTTLTTGVTIDGQANDTITLIQSGGTLTITSTNGVYVRDQNGNLVSFGNSIDVQNVTSLNVTLDQGGNDSVTDSTTLTATINGGMGNDTIRADGGGSFNPLLFQLLQQPGGINPAFLPFLIGLGGQKVLQGGAGDDSISGPFLGFFNQLDGGDGNDTIIGGFGPDFITGGNGFDILFGLGGNDFYIALDQGPDFILNQRGDTVFSDTFDILAFSRNGRGNF